ncbi:hypothetical protein GQ43DRAFT_431973 [Delitschia confertaspora ATCC 74209]|uniref:Uncharacterized protein n=1 Tax=Delitschia confertaspora ATCC 74209 TaxID=1513339 RepID=A0A9P4JR29_9PLEO|nr:hypothetical protein GQ43DRAFT_431973 [Delitschia confertaspora ATCC 74209]
MSKSNRCPVVVLGFPTRTPATNPIPQSEITSAQYLHTILPSTILPHWHNRSAFPVWPSHPNLYSPTSEAKLSFTTKSILSNFDRPTCGQENWEEWIKAWSYAESYERGQDTGSMYWRKQTANVEKELKEDSEVRLQSRSRMRRELRNWVSSSWKTTFSRLKTNLQNISANKHLFWYEPEYENEGYFADVDGENEYEMGEEMKFPKIDMKNTVKRSLLSTESSKARDRTNRPSKRAQHRREKSMEEVEEEDQCIPLDPAGDAIRELGYPLSGMLAVRRFYNRVWKRKGE